MSVLSIASLFQLGMERLALKHQQEEFTKVGTLRGGNTGALTAGGSVMGKCARLSLLRFKGIEIEEDRDSAALMFQAGNTNEDSWYETLAAAWDGVILRETEVPIKWATSGGIPVTGRPDLVLGHVVTDEQAEKLKESNVPVVPSVNGQVRLYKGIELKLASSLWTVRDVGFQMKPKLVHILQAVHYSWKLGVPFELWYTNRVHFAVLGWAVKLFPKQGEPGSELCEYGDDGIIKKVLPFVQGYELRFVSEDSYIEYRVVGTRNWVATPVKVENIARYYDYVAEMEAKKDLGPRPINPNADGSKGSFNICGYCELQDVCNAFEDKGFEAWLKAAKQLARS